MGRSWRSKRPIDLIRLTLLIVTLCFGAVTQAAEPIKIGMSMALTGPLAGTGKAALLGTQIWVEDINAKGGILGRPIQLIYYDDQSNPSLVPGIYTKLIDVDKVDLVTSGYATNMVAPAMPIVMGHGLVFVGLYALDVNAQFNYDRYFSIVPQGTEARLEFSRGFYQVALSMDPKPATVAIVGADAEYAHIATDGARENAQKLGLKIVYDRTYPPNTVDFVPIVRAIQATSPDLVFLASYPLDSAGMVPRRQRSRAENKDVRRRHGRPAICGAQAARSQLFGPRKRDRCADRAEWCRQDDEFQPYHRLPSAGLGFGVRVWSRTRRSAAIRDLLARLGAHISGGETVWRNDGLGQCDDRCTPARQKA
jgi:hypothetical protein